MLFICWFEWCWEVYEDVREHCCLHHHRDRRRESMIVKQQTMSLAAVFVALWFLGCCSWLVGIVCGDFWWNVDVHGSFQSIVTFPALSWWFPCEWLQVSCFISRQWPKSMLVQWSSEVSKSPAALVVEVDMEDPRLVLGGV